MPSMGNQQLLVVAMTGWFALVMMPLSAGSAQENWIEQITHQVQEQQRLATQKSLDSGYERYLRQLQLIQQALTHGQVRVVQHEMGHLIGMLATKEGGIADSSALSLLYYVGEVTPVEYLDENARTHLRLIKERFNDRAEAIDEPPEDSSYNTIVPPRTALWVWGGVRWMGTGTFNPIIALGVGVLLFFAVGISVLLLAGLGLPSTNGGGPSRTKEAESDVARKQTKTAGPRQHAA